MTRRRKSFLLLSPVFRVSESLQQVFSNRAQIKSEQLDLERQLKENELRQRYSEEDKLQVQYISANEKTEKTELQVNDLEQHIKQMVKFTALQDQENKHMQNCKEADRKNIVDLQKAAEVIQTSSKT
ncbi:kinesin-like protein KIF18A isoform X2 [Vanacampus margaritifer]